MLVRTSLAPLFSHTSALAQAWAGGGKEFQLWEARPQQLRTGILSICYLIPYIQNTPVEEAAVFISLGSGCELTRSPGTVLRIAGERHPYHGGQLCHRAIPSRLPWSQVKTGKTGSESIRERVSQKSEIKLWEGHCSFLITLKGFGSHLFIWSSCPRLTFGVWSLDKTSLFEKLNLPGQRCGPTLTGGSGLPDLGKGLEVGHNSIPTEHCCH